MKTQPEIVRNTNNIDPCVLSGGLGEGRRVSLQLHTAVTQHSERRHLTDPRVLYLQVLETGWGVGEAVVTAANYDHTHGKSRQLADPSVLGLGEGFSAKVSHTI